MSDGVALAVICKSPVPGRVKTRLTPPCTPAEAAALAEAALRDTFAAVRATHAVRRIAVLDGAPGPWLGPGIEVVPHCGYLGAGFLATVHIAASMGDVLVERLGIDLEASPFGPFAEITNGVARVPQGPGLGHDPDPALIARYRTHEPNVVQ